LLVRKEGSERSELTSSLAGSFAFYFLGFEVTSKLLWSGLQRVGAEGWAIAAGFTLVGLLATLLMTQASNLSSADQGSSWRSKVTVATGLWSDPAVFLLSGLNLTFGFSAAFMNGYVNSKFTAVQIGPWAVPLFAAATALVAALLSKVLGAVAIRAGKGFVLSLGSLGFFCIASSFFMLDQSQGWNGWLLALYLMQGLGRAVYESTSKGVFADFFPGRAVGAFANCMLQSSSAFAMCFFLSDVLQGPELARIVMVLSVLTPLGYLSAVRLRALEQQRLAAKASGVQGGDAERAL